MLADRMYRIARQAQPSRYAKPPFYLFHPELHIGQADEEEGRGHIMHALGKEIGGIEVGYPGGDNAVAERMFPGAVPSGKRVSRIHGIDLDDQYQGMGLGQLLYLHGLLNGETDYLYNSQTEPPATNALKAMARKRLINLLWWPREPGYGQQGGVHLLGPTDEGRRAYDSASTVNFAKLQALLDSLRGGG